jgi:predicted HAD superfamily Cof-like phosphohydrolase
MDWQQQVKQFMVEIKGLELPRQPTVAIDHLTRALCRALMIEELEELKQAMEEEDIVEIADGIADLIYVALYTANAYGILMEPVFKEVQRSNMAKKGGPKAANGKQQKPEGWTPPDIASIIKAQQYRPSDIGRILQ